MKHPVRAAAAAAPKANSHDAKQITSSPDMSAAVVQTGARSSLFVTLGPNLRTWTTAVIRAGASANGYAMAAIQDRPKPNVSRSAPSAAAVPAANIKAPIGAPTNK